MYIVPFFFFFFTQEDVGEYIHNNPLEVFLKDVMDRRQAKKNQLNNDDTHHVPFYSEVYSNAMQCKVSNS